MKPPNWLEKRQTQFRAKNGAIREKIAPIRANQITGATSDFKMGVINSFTNFIYLFVFIFTVGVIS